MTTTNVESGPDIGNFETLEQYDAKEITFVCKDNDQSEDMESDTWEFVVWDPRTNGSETTVTITDINLTKNYVDPDTTVVVPAAQVESLTQELRKYSVCRLRNITKKVTFSKGTFRVADSYEAP